MSGISPAAAIIGCAGKVLTPAERSVIAENNPFGLILFKRNIDTPEQVHALTADFRDLVGREDAPVLIDQEGGRVRRLGPPHWPVHPAPGIFAMAARKDLDLAVRAIQAFAVATALDLRDLGISVNAVPCLDLALPGQSDVVGDRSLGVDAADIIPLASALTDGYRAAGVQVIMKHLPGHGRATVDSHHALPEVTATLGELASDILPFSAFAREGGGAPPLPWGMTAHVVYTAVDPTRPGTLSPRVIDGLIREEIGFNGLLVTDDLTMKALSGPIAYRAAAALAAGCDVALHCDGAAEDYAATLRQVGPLSSDALDRWTAAKQWAGEGNAEIIALGSERWRQEGQNCLEEALQGAGA